jgi:hypothetical protein
MKMKIRNNLASKVILVLLVCSISFSLLNLASIGKSDPLVYEDNKDDIHSVSMLEVLEYMEDGGASLDSEAQIIQLIGKLSEKGTITATPDDIDIISIALLNTSLKIFVEEQPSLLETDIMFFFTINSTEKTVFGQGDLEEGSYEMDYHNGSSIASRDIVISENYYELTFPNISIKTPDLHLVIMKLDEKNFRISFDLYSSSDIFGESINTNKGEYNGEEPFTNFIDDLSATVFPFFSGRLNFFILLFSLLILGRVFLERGNKYLTVAGEITLGISLWLSVWYSFGIDLNVSNSFLSISIISVINLIAIISLIAFTLISMIKIIDVFKREHFWLFYLCNSCLFANGLLYLTPFFYFYAQNDPVVSIISHIIVLILAIVILKISSKYGGDTTKLL